MCTYIDNYHRYVETFCHYLKRSLFTTVKNDEVSSFETMITLYQTKHFPSRKSRLFISSVLRASPLTSL